MNSFNRFRKLLVLPILLIPIIGFSQQTWDAGIKGGIIFPGEVYIDPPDMYLYTETGFAVQLYADYLISPKFSAGVFFFHTSVEDEDFGETANVNTFGITLKARIPMAKGFALRPGIAFGYQLISGEYFDDVDGLDIGAFIEVHKTLNKGGLIGELGFITQPAGGNPDSDVTFGPILYLLIGYEIGK